MDKNTRWTQDAYAHAYTFAANAHHGQMVPGTGISYLMHLSFVAMEIIAALRAEAGRNETLAVQCALLHDTLEDTPTTLAQLESEFGRDVASGVSALTKDAALAKEQRMSDSLRRIQKQPPEVWMVKLADRITNLQPPPPHWSVEKIAKYKVEAAQIHETLGSASPFLSARLIERLATYGA